MRFRSSCAALGLVVLLSSLAVAEDLHRLWEERCAACHGDAGPFARSRLQGGIGAGPGQHSEAELKAFLQHHRGGLSPSQADAVLAMLKAQAESGGEFRQRCGLCHPRAADLVREKLVMRDGELYGRYTNRPMREFLLRHGRLTPDEVPRFLALLERIEAEVHRP